MKRFGREAVAFGWIEGGKVCLSRRPKQDGKPKNIYDDAADALADASTRGLSIEWEDAGAIDGR